MYRPRLHFRLPVVGIGCRGGRPAGCPGGGRAGKAGHRRGRQTATLRFAHEQIRQTLLGRLSFLRRQRLHKRIADTLEKLYATNLDEHVSELAYHLTQAGVGERAAKYLHQAGVAAAARLAVPEALTAFARAAELAGPGPSAAPRCVPVASCC